MGPHRHHRFPGILLALLCQASGSVPAAAEALPAGLGPADPCVSPRFRPAHELDAILVAPRGFPPGLEGVVDDAMAAWNGPACNSNAGFPRFEYRTALSHRVLVVRYVTGEAASGAGRCGAFAGNEVTIYSHARDPVDGSLRSCGGPEHLSDTLSHELGHVLGLEDQLDPACSGHIMGQLSRDVGGRLLRRRLQPAECAAADRLFLTARERTSPPAGRDSTARLDGPLGAGAIRLPGESARSRPRFSRTVRGSPETGSDACRP